MTLTVDIANRALQIPGTRTSVTATELANNSTNEAIQLNLAYNNCRKKLLRMAPWGSALKVANLNYITSSPGTPENTSPATTLWQPGQPAPPWAYEYQYPVDCLRACWLIPTTQTGFAGGIPISTAVTGGAQSFWSGPPVRFQTQTDAFYSVNTASIVSGGTGHAVGDILTMPGTVQGNAPIGAPVQLLVTTVSAGVITAVSVISNVIDTLPANAVGGSYFAIQANPVSQASSSGSGTGASFNFTWNGLAPQRVILTNQEFATMAYIQDLVDPNIMDDMLQDALAKTLGATVTIPLTGDKKLANFAIQEANQIIMAARTADANEGLVVNDVTPDWIRVRGIDFATSYSGPYTGFDWGGGWPAYG
jgi:hypothetical protein